MIQDVQRIEKMMRKNGEKKSYADAHSAES